MIMIVQMFEKLNSNCKFQSNNFQIETINNKIQFKLWTKKTINGRNCIKWTRKTNFSVCTLDHTEFMYAEVLRQDLSKSKDIQSNQ